MDNFTHVLNRLLGFLMWIGDMIVGVIVMIELWLRLQLSHFGLPPKVQTLILLGAAVVLILAALKLFGGLIRVAVVVILLLIGMHIFLPIIQN